MSNKLIDCWLCGTPHEYCPTCGEYHGWRYMADTREHYQILMIKQQCEGGVFSKEEATSLFEEYGVKADANLSWMLPEVEKEIRDIIGEKPAKATKTIKKETKSKIFND